MPAEQQAELRAITDKPDDGLPLLSIEDLAELPEPSWLLDGFLPTGGFSVLYGPSGVGKSFLALDWALCVASGLAWYGRQSQPGWVVYIAAEGVAGMYPRIAAWQTARDTTVESIRFIPIAVNLLLSPEVDRARHTIATLPEPPALVVIDTMARTMVSGDENAARDVGLFIAGADQLRADSAALIVHHTGKSGDEERGSSALRGAADMMHALKPDGSGLRLDCEKAKDSEPYEPWRLHLSPESHSCVIRCGTDTSRLAPSEVTILTTVSESFGTDGASSTAIREASGIPKSSYYRSLRALVDRRFLHTEETPRGDRYSITAVGLQQLVPDSPNESHGTAEPVPSQTPPFKGRGTRDGNATENTHG